MQQTLFPLERKIHLTEIEQDFLDVITNHAGEENSITATDLKPLFNISSREVRRIVHRLRVAGHPIGSSNKGYYLAQTKQELKGTINFLRSYIRQIEEVATALEKVDLPDGDCDILY